VPTGQASDFTGAKGFTFTPTVAVARSEGPVRVLVNLGHRFQDNIVLGDVSAGNELLYRIAIGYRFDIPDHETEAALALLGSSSTAATSGLDRFDDPGRNPVELDAQLTHRLVGPLTVFVGGGAALATGAGVPDVRLFGGIRWSERPGDDDGDHVLGDADRCPRVAGEVKNAGCPDLDRDNDGIVDRLDQCPNAIGPIENHGGPVVPAAP
jgi:hypothetical protein